MPLLEPQPLKTNEMIARQKRLEAAFSVDIVRRELRPAAEATFRTPTHIRDYSLALTGVQEAPPKVRGSELATHAGALRSPHTRDELYSMHLADGSP